MKRFWAPRTQRGIRMLEKAGVEYELEAVGIRSEPHYDCEEFLRASSMGETPALIDGDVAMPEPAAICLHVADRCAARPAFQHSQSVQTD